LVVALVLSFAVNVFSGELVEDVGASVKSILQFGFFVISAALGYRLFMLASFPPIASRAFAFGMAVMSLFIVAENVAFGSLLSTGGWSRLTRMSQNSYAVQFSSYLPFVYYAAVASVRKTTRMWWALTGCFCLLSVLVNGSRTAWVTTLLTMLIFLGLYSFVLKKYKATILTALVAPMVFLAGWTMLPESLKSNLEKDFNTYDNLEADKSWMIRQLQIQKSMKIFDESPWLGVGPAQFRNQAIGLDMPDVLAGRSAQEFSAVSAHNSYVQFLSEGGLIFMVPFALMLSWLLVAGARASIILARAGEVWALALFAGLIGLSVHFWTISGLTTTGPWFLYGAMAATITKARLVQRGLKPNLAGNIRWVK
jgi:O-antigen ligase